MESFADVMAQFDLIRGIEAKRKAADRSAAERVAASIQADRDRGPATTRAERFYQANIARIQALAAELAQRPDLLRPRSHTWADRSYGDVRFPTCEMAPAIEVGLHPWTKGDQIEARPTGVTADGDIVIMEAAVLDDDRRPCSSPPRHPRYGGDLDSCDVALGSQRPPPKHLPRPVSNRPALIIADITATLEKLRTG